MHTQCDEETHVKLGKLILKLRKKFDFIDKVFIGTLDKVPLVAMEIATGSIFALERQDVDAFILWNLKNYAPNSIMRNAAITRVLLEFASIENANENKVRFGIYYLGNVYSLKDIVDTGTIVRLNVSNLKRIVYAVSK